MYKIYGCVCVGGGGGGGAGWMTWDITSFSTVF